MAKFERLERARTHTNVISHDLSQNARPIHICNTPPLQKMEKKITKSSNTS